ncbi:stage II sporulation protein M [Kineococcus indalonis]|uniref:stage II sporulation protein M n=1 Tax=Kineococcus indalonis TaxID=2696566 RepID=UPI001411E507|nr:stage II sporulation protein M [Kineococcus indalonis]NAZ86541.1 stage II sporulation protein M [Kineococcus indalonis]
MDVDAFRAVHEQEWARLRALVRQRRLTGVQADELVVLYQRTATHLSVLRSAQSEPVLLDELSTLLVRARSRLTGSRYTAWRQLRHFTVRGLPAALWRLRWWSLAATAYTLVLATAAGAWIAGDSRAQASLFGSDEDIRRLVEEDFAGYYSEYAHASFAGRVWTNNAVVAATCVVLGITGVFVLLALTQNALNVGLQGGLLVDNGRGEVFFGLIAPHGILELTAVFVAAAAGSKLFWTWVAPGTRGRAQALATEGRAMVGVALGLVLVLFVSGLIEGFVTPSPLPTAARIAVGVLAEVAFLLYVVLLGRPAAAAGETGDVEARFAGDVAPVRG